MKYEILLTGEVVERYRLNELYPNVGWGSTPDKEILDFLGIREVPDDGDIEPIATEDFILTSVRSRKDQEINSARLTANLTTFTHMGKQIACDKLSQIDIDKTSGYITLWGTLPLDWLGGWKAIDNSFVPINTVEDWKDLYKSLFTAGNNNFIHSQQLKNLITTTYNKYVNKELTFEETLQELEEIKW